MDGLLVILIILFLVTASGKKKKKKTGGGLANYLEKLMEERGNMESPEAEEAEEGDSHEGPAPIKKPARKKAETASHAGGFADEQGCVGGSLPHMQHEGESRQEHAAHARRYMEEEQAAAQAEDIARELHDMNLHQLRRAVVVSEILGKPKALRR